MSQDHDSSPGQTDTSLSKNISFFREHHHLYEQNINELDTYIAIRASVNQALQGINQLLDIGNGGVFDYETSLVRTIVALDLFFDHLPASFSRPANVTLRTGSALNIPEQDDTFDGVLIVMLIHHLVGRTVKESIRNVDQAVREAFRVLRPGGRLIILESCVPRWFYLFENAVFPFAAAVINAILPHPATLQYPASLIRSILRRHSPSVEVLRIPKGRYILQFGYKFPSILTPAIPYRFIAYKHKPLHMVRQQDETPT